MSVLTFSTQAASSRRYSLATDLVKRYGRGFSKSNLYLFVSFYVSHPDFFQSLTGKSPIRLSWTHYSITLQVEDTEARSWYEHEAATEMWSTRTLQRKPKVESIVRDNILSNFSIIGNIPPKDVSFSDFICIFAMLDEVWFNYFCNTKLSESSDMAKSWATFCCSGYYKS